MIRIYASCVHHGGRRYVWTYVVQRRGKTEILHSLAAAEARAAVLIAGST